jgi:polysaccharide deacetylase family protein (PEP-CTERM system associated)
MSGSAPPSSISPAVSPAVVVPSLVLSFDIEEHDRIEAANAVGLSIADSLKATYAERMEAATRRLLDLLAEHNAYATFFIVGEIARRRPRLVRDIAAAGHEIGGHSWDHRRVHRFDACSFAEDLRITKDALEQASGFGVFGFRAPTFSVMESTAWAVDVLAASGYSYDTSIYPVRHDRYGVPDAPRGPFTVVGPGGGEMLELPPVTYRVSGQNLPMAGGGYFRLFPLWATKLAVRQMLQQTIPPVAMMYFHPWEFDPGQPKLPLKRLSKFRTYVGIRRSLSKLDGLMRGVTFRRAIDVVTELQAIQHTLPRYVLGERAATVIATRMTKPETVAVP